MVRNNTVTFYLRSIIIAMTCLLLPVRRAEAKKDDFFFFFDFSAVKKFNAFSVGLLGEFFTRENSTAVDKLSIGFKGEYAVKPWLNAGTGYLLMNFNRTGYHELVDRFYLQMEPIMRIANLYLSFRERIQVTLYPETRTNAFTTWYWRNRLELQYKKNRLKVEPYCDLEIFYMINDPDPNPLNEFRFTLGGNYRFNPRQRLKMYGMLTDGVFLNRYVLGLSYEFKL